MPMRRWPRRYRWSIASAAALALSMCTLGMPSRGLNSQPLTTGAQRGAIAAHQRRRFLRQTMAEEDQAVGFLPLQHQRVAILALLVVLGVAEQHGVALTLRGVFDSLEDQREERIGDVGHGDQQLAGARACGGSWRRSWACSRGPRPPAALCGACPATRHRAGSGPARRSRWRRRRAWRPRRCWPRCRPHHTEDKNVDVVARSPHNCHFCLDSPLAPLYPLGDVIGCSAM